MPFTLDSARAIFSDTLIADAVPVHIHTTSGSCRLLVIQGKCSKIKGVIFSLLSRWTSYSIYSLAKPISA